MKKILFVILVLCSLILTTFIANYVGNEKMISNYNNNKYNQNKFADLNITEKCVTYYNSGNIYFKKLDYEKAIIQYKKALNENPSKDLECKIRINLALAMTSEIDIRSISPDSKKRTIRVLEKAKDLLTKDGNATENNDGKDKDSQTLYNDIDDFINLIKKDVDSTTYIGEPTPQNNGEKIQDSDIDIIKQEQDDAQRRRAVIKDADNSVNSQDFEAFENFNGKGW